MRLLEALQIDILKDEALPSATGITVAIVVVVALFLVWGKWCQRTNENSYPNYDEIPATVLSHMASKEELKEISGNVDVAVIGSGIGALSSAVVLAKAGYRVAVFEQHYVVGGSTHRFTHEGFDFDVGVHYVGNMLDCRWSPFRVLFDFLSDGKLEWSRINETFDVAFNNTTRERLEFTGDPKANRNMLLNHFHNLDPRDLDKYYQKCGYARMVASIYFALKCLPPCVTRIVWLLGYAYWFRKVCLGRTIDIMKIDCGLPDDVIGGKSK